MSFKIGFTPDGWEQYLYWQTNDKSLIRRINVLIKELMRHPMTGKGEPEMLKGNLQGYWSRRIDQEHRLVYRILETEVEISACRFHYHT